MVVPDHEFTMAQAIAEKYLGKVVQIYCDDTSGYTRYSDFDIEQKIYIEGKVLWGKGMVICLECDIPTPEGLFKKEVLVSCWSVTAIMEKSSDVQITHLFQGTNR